MSSLREQIAAKRAEVRKAATPVKTPARARAAVAVQDDTLSEERSVSSQIKKAVRSGKLDLSDLALHRIPVEVYTTLAQIPTDSLSRPASPPRRQESAIRPYGSTPQRDLPERREDVFNQPTRETWVDPEELTSFKAPDNRILELEIEIGAFGGLKVMDLRANGLKSLPDSFADLLRLASIDLSHNAFTSIPPAILLLPALQVLDLSYNTITTIDLSSPIPPSEEGLSYGAGFLTTSFSRAQKRSPLSIWPVLRTLNLSNNRISNDGLKGLNVSTRLESMRILNLARNALQGVLDVESIGAGIDDMPGLTSLVLSGNARLRGTEGDLAPGAVIEMEGCGVAGGSSRMTTSSHQAESQAAAGDTPFAPKPVGNGSGIPLPDLTMVYRTCPAATFDSEPLNIQFDLYLPPQAGNTPVPLVIWFHGGGLLQGNKENLPPHLRRLPQHSFAGDQHIAVISPNYRLAPQVPIIDILSDITSVFSFVKTRLNDQLKKEGRGEYVIDTERICVSGGSAGGYLALIAGLQVPKSASDEVVGGYRGEGGVKCIAPFYPITDLTDEFWSTETNPVPWYGRSVSHAEAKPFIDTKAAPVDTAISGGPRSILYPYMLQHSLFPSLLFKAQRSIGRGLDGFRPTPESLSIPQRLKLLMDSNTKTDNHHVPIYLIYGDSDTAVQKFDKTVEALKGVQGELEIEVREGLDHAFDEDEKEECLAFRDWLGRTLL